jgi:hypothetical protein
MTHASTHGAMEHRRTFVNMKKTLRAESPAPGSAPAAPSSAPGFGPSRPAFGMVKDQGRRIEITLVLKNGGSLLAIEEMANPLTPEAIEALSDQLAKGIASGTTRSFADGWNATGQYAWVNLGEVIAFSLRPAK